ncbi:MAG: NAD(P)H-dependent oxidoreductase subunit E [Pseudomonadota bacterium]|nr:NAD(P)H-dependent oxidoreductase subunit E [Pseudomonadota bacterium]
MSFRSAPLTVAAEPHLKETLFTPETRSEIDRMIEKYPDGWKQSAVMPALTVVQEANGGWLTRELMDDVATYLDMPPVAVYEAATFYGMYDLESVGRHKVCVCNSVSCLLCGSEELMEHVEKKYGVRPGETTPDGKFTLKEVECLGACKDAPAVLIGKTYHEKPSFDVLDKLIDELE